MAVSPRAVRVLSKILDAGFTDEESIIAMTIDDILSVQGVTVEDVTLINILQESIRTRKVISFLDSGVRHVIDRSGVPDCTVQQPDRGERG